MQDRVQACSHVCISQMDNGETHYRMYAGPALHLRNAYLCTLSLHVRVMQILKKDRSDWEVSEPSSFQFKSDRITATLEKKCHVHGDWCADFTGASQVC